MDVASDGGWFMLPKLDLQGATGRTRQAFGQGRAVTLFGVSSKL